MNALRPLDPSPARPPPPLLDVPPPHHSSKDSVAQLSKDLTELKVARQASHTSAAAAALRHAGGTAGPYAGFRPHGDSPPFDGSFSGGGGGYPSSSAVQKSLFRTPHGEASFGGASAGVGAGVGSGLSFMPSAGSTLHDVLHGRPGPPPLPVPGAHHGAAGGSSPLVALQASGTVAVRGLAASVGGGGHPVQTSSYFGHSAGPAPSAPTIVQVTPPVA
jgi:hypothetical protein